MTLASFLGMILYPPLSILWATMWLMVAYHYGRAAWTHWRANAATPREILSEIFDPIFFAVRDFACRSGWFSKMIGLSCPRSEPDIIPTKSPGNILRFAIFVGSFTPIVFGFTFAFVEPGAHGDSWKLIVAMVFMFTSILGALGHLFLAHRGNPRVWSNIVVYGLLWLVLSPILFTVWRNL